jgi:hypothetical protein
MNDLCDTRLQHNIHAWAVREAEEILSRGGPQPFNRLALWIAGHATHAFKGGHGISTRRVVRAALEEAATVGRFVASWQYNANEQRMEPRVVRMPHPTEATT